MSKFKAGDWVRFKIDSLDDKNRVESFEIDISKSYKVIEVRNDKMVTSYMILDIDVTEGDGWGEEWFELDKKSIVKDIINDL